MNPPASRLLRRLNAAIAAARDPYSADCAHAERACYLARQGDFAEASRTITTLRKHYAPHPDATMSAWLNLAEGLVSYYSELGSIAYDKVLRAHALSAAVGLVYLNALTAAWLAQMGFSKLDAAIVATRASEALRLSALDHHSARARASLVIAQALHSAARWDLAAPWYTKARLHATDEGDDLTISALMHNMVGMRLDNFRQAILAGRGDPREAESGLVALASSENFDLLVGTSTLEPLRPMLRARFLSLQARTDEALDIYEAHFPAQVSSEIARMASDVLSDIAWCRLKRGDLARARSDAMAAEQSLTPQTQIDERAATHSRLANIYRELDETPQAQRHAQLADTAWREFESLQQQFVNLLGRMTENGTVPSP
jgi:tetratricopeptide (TPR) repeat protein